MFVTFIENNSEDYYIQNKDINGVVIIEGEGESLEEIFNKANYIFKNYREYYRGCEERWDDDLKDEEDLDKEPMIFNKSAHNFTDSCYTGCKPIIYRVDRAKEVTEV